LRPKRVNPARCGRPPSVVEPAVPCRISSFLATCRGRTRGPADSRPPNALHMSCWLAVRSASAYASGQAARCACSATSPLTHPVLTQRRVARVSRSRIAMASTPPAATQK
jgi:hypothetical protein